MSICFFSTKLCSFHVSAAFSPMTVSVLCAGSRPYEQVLPRGDTPQPLGAAAQ